jgi:hypothetical protein
MKKLSYNFDFSWPTVQKALIITNIIGTLGTLFINNIPIKYSS